MADRNVESDELGVPQIDETLEILLLQAIEEAQERMEAGSEVVPFTALLNGETVTEDTHTGTTEECFESARKTVEAATGARAYVLCYDGYIDTDAGRKDAIIAEGGTTFLRLTKRSCISPKRRTSWPETRKFPQLSKTKKSTNNYF